MNRTSEGHESAVRICATVALDGKTEIHTLAGTGLVVSAVDFNKVVAQRDELLMALQRLEHAVALHMGIRGQTTHLKGFGYSQTVRKEVFDAQEQAAAAIAKATS